METPESGRLHLLKWLSLPVLLISVLVTALVVHAISDHSERLKTRILAEQHNRSTIRIADRISHLIRSGELLADIPIADENSFRARARTLLEQEHGLISIEFLSTVSADQRAMAEAQMSRDIGRPIQFSKWQANSQALMNVAHDASHYLVIRWSEGDPSTKDSVGLVADSVPPWQGPIADALSQHIVTTTPLTELSSGPVSINAIRIFIPAGTDDLLSLVIDPEALMESTLLEQRTPDTALSVYDLSQQSKTPLFQLSSIGEAEPEAALRSELTIGSRQWLVTTTPTQSFFTDESYGVEQKVWLAGIILTALITTLVAVLVRRLLQVQARYHHASHRGARLQQLLENNQVEKTILKQALNNSELRSRDLVMLTGGFVCELDDQLNITFISPQAADVLGEAPAELAELAFETRVATDDRANFLAALAAARREKNMERIDLHMVAAEGRSIALTLRIKAVIDPISGCTGFRMTGQRTLL